MANSISIVFFDIGDVLFDEDVQHMWLFHTLLLTLRKHNKDVFWDDWNATRIALAAKGPNPEAAIKDALAFYCAGEAETEVLWDQARRQYAEMRKPRPYGLLLNGITPVLRELKKDYRLGIIANQHPQVSDALYNYGVRSLFEVVVISETVGLYKPDPAIFRYGLGQAQVDASQAVFVGDRPDNDIKPAKSLGMRTIRFRRGVHYIHYNPTEAEFAPDAQISDVSELAGAVHEVCESP